MRAALRQELEWRARFPARARARRQMVGLFSYDYQLNPEYQSSLALDSKAYRRFQAGALRVRALRVMVLLFMGYQTGGGGKKR